MSIHNVLEKILNSKVAEKTYDDLLSVPLQETSKVLTDLVKTVRYVLPFQYIARLEDCRDAEWQTRFDRLKKRLGASVQNVPEENIIKPPDSFSVPIIQHLSYIEEGNILVELFQNLLSRAMDKTRNSEAHPAFITLINQLSPDEAVLLSDLKSKGIEYISIGEYEHQGDYSYDFKIVSNNYDIGKLIFPKNFLMYLNHLNKLDLIIFHKISEPIIDEGICEFIRFLSWAEPVDKDAFKKAHIGTRETCCVELTEFGELFLKACFE